MKRRNRLIVLLIALSLAGCGATIIKTESPILAYTGDLTIKVLACDFQVKCLGGFCSAKLVCPPGIEHNPK